MTPLRWQRLIAVVIAIIVGVVCAGLGWLSQDAVSHGPIVLRGVRPAADAAVWQYWLATIAWGGTAFGAVLFVGWQYSIQVRHLALAGTLLFGGFAVEQARSRRNRQCWSSGRPSKPHRTDGSW